MDLLSVTNYFYDSFVNGLIYSPNVGVQSMAQACSGGDLNKMGLCPCSHGTWLFFFFFFKDSELVTGYLELSLGKQTVKKYK